MCPSFSLSWSNNSPNERGRGVPPAPGAAILEAAKRSRERVIMTEEFIKAEVRLYVIEVFVAESFCADVRPT